ncbi:ABC transporter substrate-binding protein [Paenibacillus thermoaerophilus]|uniref:ABC transporter substrate-binding protein n=1 Tax=Paenibacillus thermoaerophilus TaxID=1215385 RepID=A0ABW2V0I5_9BACL|nr:ABC transporter substrate-binding protein [Paenibacillus thermoaerophilus]TMV11014.1 carbohydrate ABC transporter substrate-binding protein [Paenibacillus thermoaerophilus]
MKKGLVVLTAASLLAMAGCGTDKTNDNAGGGGSGQQVKTIKIFQFKVEIAEALRKMADEYEKEHPNIKIEIETIGGGGDYGAALKTKFAAGEYPDIFNNGGFNELNVWQEHLEDLSNEPWVKDVLPVAKEPMTKDGKLYGQPLGLEGYGFIYNKDLFAKAGITELPKTLSQLKDTAEKLKAAGITPFMNGYGEWWILGIHNLNIAFAQQPDPNAFIKGLNDGSAKIPGNPVFANWTKLLDLTLQYGQPNPLATDYNAQVTNFANGQAAMMQQGNWTQVQISKTNPNIKLGMLPMPISDDAAANDKLAVGVPNNWVVYNKSPVKQEAKDFLNWMVSSEVGKRYIVEEFKFIPAFSNIEVKDPAILGDLANEIIAYSKDNKTLSWNWFKFPDGATNEFGAHIQAYIGKKVDAAGLLENFQKTWDTTKAK